MKVQFDSSVKIVLGGEAAEARRFGVGKRSLICF